MKEMNELLYRLLLGQLQSMGLLTEKDVEIADIKTKLKLSDLYDRWLKESIRVLALKNYLIYNKKTCVVADIAPVEIDAVWKEWDGKKDTWLKDPDMKAQAVLVEATLKALPEILTGKIPATDIMFPNSSMELVEDIYKNNVVSDYFNEVLADTITAYIEERLVQDPSARIRIIEIGAGTGGTSAMVFRKLKPYKAHIQEYCYTDISKAFLIHAEKEYGSENPYLTYQIFNVEMPAAGQGVSMGRYDIAIATNVLHATKNIRQTLRNTKAVLRKSGLILLNEISKNTLVTHLTFGLLEGWWLYEDQELRIPGCPGLYPEAWKVVLENEGFRSVFFPSEKMHDLGQQIIVAESDGVIRQKQQLKPAVKQTVGTKAVKKQSPEQKPLKKQTGESTQELLKEKTTAYIKKLVGETLRIPVNKIDSSEPLEKYGIDSILIVQLANAFRKVLDNVSSTLFFEYQTIDALVEHFIKTQRESLIKLVGFEEQVPDEGVSDLGEIAIETPIGYPKPILRKSRRLFHSNNTKIESSEYSAPMIQEIAIIGLSGRYPEAENVNVFWNNLREGRNCITEIPKERWDWKQYFDEGKGKWGKTYSKWGGFIKNIDKFDPLFFNISPKEAEMMDPQERLFLEVAYASIEDAGYTPATLSSSRRIGVFAGVMNGNYPSGSRYWSIANRVSYVLNFQGPSLSVDTACSSSLTAIHLAMESLNSGMSECAIAGGVNLVVDPVHYLRLSIATMISPGNECKSFGDGADGFVDGEGVGAIVLKPLKKAIEDGDHIYGVLKGSMLNAGGKTNGFTVPNPNAQFELVSEALKRARVKAREITYIEAHGTGTALGDPIEIAGLTRAFEQDTKDKQFCAIGSAKSNIGHCESAAGIAGVTKVLLQFKYGQLVPSLHSSELNPNIDFINTPFIVQQELEEWKRPIVESNGETREYPRIAGISSFGAGGANTHILIEEYIPEHKERPRFAITADNPAIITLSAKNEERLKEQVQQLLAAIRDGQFSDSNLADMAYTLQVGREAMDERLGLIVESIKELEEKLKNFTEGSENIEYLYRGQVKRNKEMLAVLTADEEMHEMLEKWIQRRKYGKLMELWVKGLSIDWSKLYGDIKPCRISLPTYPFAKEHYWARKLSTESLPVTVSNEVTDFSKRSFENAAQPKVETAAYLEDSPVKINIATSQPITAEGVNFSSISEKPRGVSLLTLSGDQILQGNLTEQPRHSITLSDAGLALSQSSDSFKQQIYVQTTVSVESLQKELVASLAKALYMKPDDIDVDKKFIDMGLDSVIGVEWINTLNKQYGTSITIPNIHEYPSIRQFAEFVQKELNKCANPISIVAEVSRISLSSSEGTLQPITLSQLESTAVSNVSMPKPMEIQVRVTSVKTNISLELLQEELVTSLAKALFMKTDDIDVDKKFIDMGLDSVIGVEWINTLNKQYGTSITIPNIHEYPSIRQFAGFLQKELNKCAKQIPSASEISKISPFSSKSTLQPIPLSQLELTAVSNVSIPKPMETQERVSSVQTNISLELLQEELVTSLAKALFMKPDDIDEDKKFIDMGLDSVIGVEWINALNKQYGISITIPRIHEYPTIHQFARFLQKELNKSGHFLPSQGLSEFEENKRAILPDLKDFVPVAEPIKLEPVIQINSGFTSPSIHSPVEKDIDRGDIAIISISGRYPGAGNIQEFWENLKNGKDCISEIPKDRWDYSLYFDEERNKYGKTYCKWGGFIEDVDRFDPLFFNISPRQAVILDPQERLFLETVWNLFESTGYTLETLQSLYKGKVGVYVGTMYQQYSDVANGAINVTSFYSSIANRVSYFFNLQGPSLAIDTMCSSSAVAIHMACESLLKGECQLAVAGGINLSLHPKKYLGLSLAQMIGSQINSRSFADGDGFIPAEGVGAVLLKPLSKAIQDGDSILAVIKSTSINHGGHSEGYGVPNLSGQVQLIEDNFNKSGINPQTISCIESAATGYALGDSIEVEALNKVFRKYTSDLQFCSIGSVKSNIGHAEAASGISQLTKVVLQLQNKQLVPSIKAEPLNPNINFSNTPFYLQKELKEWKRPVVRNDGKEQEIPRRAAVGSFGAGGTNVHLIIEEYIPAQEERIVSRSTCTPQIAVFSARNKERLQAVVQQVLEFVESQQELSLADLAYTLQVGREAMELRMAMIVNTKEELVQGLKGYLTSLKECKGEETSISIFTGSACEEYSKIGNSTSKRVEETEVKALSENNHLQELAIRWTQGGSVSWEALHEGQVVRKISLPTYPFEKRRFWIETKQEPELALEPNKSLNDATRVDEIQASLKDLVIGIISRLLGMAPEEINLNKPLNQYGFDSITLMQLLQQLQAQADPTLDLARLQECRTIQDVINILPMQNGCKPMVLGQQKGNVSGINIRKQFPELIHLNQCTQGRPVFWFHGGLGGVELYKDIAQKSQRPFYGIQARGWMTTRSPIHGVEAMALYYVHMIQSVQPEGPYDLGGYSLGGVLAYEVTRQLQELGQSVNTIVMLDSLYNAEMKEMKISHKALILQSVNFALLSTILQEPEKIAQTLIHREEVNSELEEEEYLKQLLMLAKNRGLTKTEEQLREFIQQCAKVQQAYGVDAYNVLPLPNPQDVTCYYFRNKSGLLYGQLEPYFLTTEDKVTVDFTNYWEEWEKNLPNYHMTDVESSNHMMLVSEPKPIETIFAFCEELYSEKGNSIEDIKVK